MSIHYNSFGPFFSYFMLLSVLPVLCISSTFVFETYTSIVLSSPLYTLCSSHFVSSPAFWIVVSSYLFQLKWLNSE
jgi:hypothetical protein